MVYPRGMNSPAKPTEPRDERTERLAAALRENLKRRKARARERARPQEQTKDTPKEDG
jgi:hypothetical protein